jgi:hypothetical protein
VSAAYDWAFFLLPPLVSLVIGIAISRTNFTDRAFQFAGHPYTGAELMIGTIIQSHLVAVLVRSHGNGEMRRRHPFRFFLVPVLLWIAIAWSARAAVAATIVATFWDVWHSGAQTFGFARIYDRNQGNAPERGRTLDLWANQLLYAGPLLAGVRLVDHVRHLDDLERVGVTIFSATPTFIVDHQRWLTWTIILGGTAFLLFYVAAYVRMHAQGHRVAPLKVFLVATTGACSIYSWGFDSWGEAFFIMNLFHAVQYLALVWHAERDTITRRLGGRRGAKWRACALYLCCVFAYGFVAELADSKRRALWAVTIVVSLIHFWYDGFIWSVKRQEV